MAIIVIALGVVMVLSGAYEIYFGNTYISVERGWSAFISGTVLFTGGLMTIALGLAIRAVTDLKAALTHQVPAAPAGTSHVEPGFAQPGFAQPDFAKPDFVQPPFSEPQFERPTPSEPAPHVTAPAMVPSSAALAETLAPEPVPEFPSEEPVPHQTAEELVPSHDHGSPPASDLKAETDHAEPTQASAEETPPVAYDWLDRSFADLGREFGPAVEPPPPQAEQDIGHPGVHEAEVGQGVGAEPLVDHHEAHEPETATVQEPTEAPHAEQPASHPEEARKVAALTSAVIGRYEAEGTSYVMYADGSIEAQSDAGVYRFASMAELKSFIEG